MFKKSKKTMAILMALAVAFVFPSLAFAATDTVELMAQIIGGALAVNAPEITDVSLPLTLAGKTQTLTFEIAADNAATSDIDESKLTIVDPTGTGAGWNVTVQATQFTNGEEPPKLLPKSSLVLGTTGSVIGEIAKIDANSSETNTITKKITDPTAIDVDSPVTILSAAADGGMGSYTVVLGNFVLTLKPATTYAINYTSIITFTLSSGPAA